MRAARGWLLWTGVALALVVPMSFAATSEYLAWRDPVYIAAGFAGVVALCLVMTQPILARGWLAGISIYRSRMVHRVLGAVLVMAVAIHVAGLWLTSPPDIVDALLLRSPTPFSVWGVAAMWAIFAAALLSALRRRFSPRRWRVVHISLVSIVVVGSVFHAMLIEGTMEVMSKAGLCALAVIATTIAIAAPWLRAKRRASGGR